MKRCPHCNADIEDEARFCIYCMTELDEKRPIISPDNSKKRWLYISVILVLLILLLASVLWGIGRNTTGPKAPSGELGVGITDGAAAPDNETLADEKGNATEAEGESDSPSSTDEAEIQPDATNAQSDDRVPQNTVGNTSGSTGQIKPVEPVESDDRDEPSTTDKTPSNEPQTAPETTRQTEPVATDAETVHETELIPETEPSAVVNPEPTQGQYGYRAAVTGDDGYGATIPADSIVITSINYTSPDGVYVIPDSIDGKRVFSIAGGVFSAPAIRDTVRVVVIPKRCRNLFYDALNYCYNLTDVYYAGEGIFLADGFLPPVSRRNQTITIHSSATATNRNFTKLKNVAYYVEAQFSEWDGVTCEW